MADLDITALDWVDIARFWSKVQAGRLSACWEWTASKTSFGHGDFKVQGATHAAHRVAYAIATGDFPGDGVVRHRCDNPACCNPHHLVVGTHADNVADRVRRQRSAFGEKSGRAKLTERDVREILSRPSATLTGLARRYGVHPSTIEAIRYRRSWRHVVPLPGIEPGSDDYESTVLPLNYSG